MKKQWLKHRQLVGNLAFTLLFICALSLAAARAEGHSSSLPAAGFQISELSPVHGEGCGYRITYRVSIDIDTLWRFKRDFNVVQQAYFDLAGTGFWEVYPWQGGMRDVLRTNAAWEQEAIMRMQAAYR